MAERRAALDAVCAWRKRSAGVEGVIAAELEQWEERERRACRGGVLVATEGVVEAMRARMEDVCRAVLRDLACLARRLGEVDEILAMGR